MTMQDPPAGNGDLVPPTIGPTGGPQAEPVSGALVGTVLAGRYRILRLLGEGAMGAVYLGEHVKIGRQDAIKVLRDNLSWDPEAIARFVRGTRNVSMIRHPNICTIYDYSDTQHGLQFVAMELVSGESLRELLQREGVLPLDRAVAIAKQVADALEAAHDAGIVHRDLKPANIMISRGKRGEDQIKVVDFDIAKGPRDGEGEEVTRHGFVVGTPEYMSPEQLIGDRLDGRSDVYSLALVLFRMLTGMLPFRGEGAQDLIVKRLTEEPMRLGEALPGVAFPEALDEAIRKALRRKPEDRQTGAEEFGNEIVAAVRLSPSSSAPAAGIGAATGVAGAGMSAPTAVGGAVPATTVQTGGVPAAAGPAPSRGRVYAGAGAVVLVLAMVAVAVALRGGADPPAEPTALQQDPPTITASTEPALGSPLDPVSGGVNASAGTAAGAGGSATPEPVRSVPAPPPPPPARGSPASAPAAIVMTPAAAGELLVRLLDRFGPPDPSAPVLRAIRDSARLVAELPDASTAQRARASYIMASALLPLGDTLQAVGLLERAVSLDPANRGYNTLLNSLPAEYRNRGR